MDILTAYRSCALRSAVNGASNSCSCLRLCARKPVFFCGSDSHPLIRTCSENGNAMSLRVISFLRAVAKGDIVICFSLFREPDWEKHILKFKKSHHSGCYAVQLGASLHRKVLGFIHAVRLAGMHQDLSPWWPWETHLQACTQETSVSQLLLEWTDIHSDHSKRGMEGGIWLHKRSCLGSCTETAVSAPSWQLLVITGRIWALKQQLGSQVPPLVT